MHAGEWQGEKSTEVSLSNRVKLETVIQSRLTVRSHVGRGAEIYMLCFQGFVSSNQDEQQKQLILTCFPDIIQSHYNDDGGRQVRLGRQTAAKRILLQV